MVNQMQDQSYLVAEQYRDSSNLRTRVGLHERFSVNQGSFVRWTFDQIDLPAYSRVLELGSGAGALWVQNADRIPAGWQITISDLSEGILAEARQSLGEDRFEIRRINAQAIPFPDATFDGVLAFHMLFHVPDLPRALGEIRRVLRPGGSFVASTNGIGHLDEMFTLVSSFDPSISAPRAQAFGLEEALMLLAPFFDDVRVVHWKDGLVVTEAGPLADFVLSSGRYRGLAPEVRPALTRFVQERIDRAGPIRITKNSGVVVAS